MFPSMLKTVTVLFFPARANLNGYSTFPFILSVSAGAGKMPPVQDNFCRVKVI